VATSQKPRAETPLLTDKGDPLLAHWQFGLGRALAFTSDAKAKWAQDWLGWPKYRQFWSQIGKWSLRRLDNADFTTDVSIEKGEGVISVEALDEKGNYRNFLNLQSLVVSPKGEKQTVRLEQTGPGHYEARFPTKDVGAYMLHLMNLEDGEVRGTQRLGASVNYSPEFIATEPNHNLLPRLAQVRAKQMPAVQPDPDLFKPQTPVVLVPTRREEVLTQPDGGATAETVSPAQPERRSASTASRLLEAKRRAQQRKDL